MSNVIKLAYSVREACTAIGCKKTFLYTLIHEKKVDARRSGRRTVITAVSLSDYVSGLPPAAQGGAT